MNNQRGILLTEILVAAMVLGTILMTAATALGVSLDAISASKLQGQASFLLQEELEPLLTIRDSGWANISANGTYYVAPSGSSWTLVSTTTGETVGQFTRSVTISNVYRDSNGQITQSGGTLDPSTKRATATISWQGFLPHTLTSTVYITRYKDNLTWVQTTQAEFNLGTKTGVAVTNTAGGEVILGAGGGGDWCGPNLSIAALDLPKNGVANAVTAIEGRAFAATGDNSSGVAFANVNITNTHPPVSSILGTFDNYKTNGVFGETNYAYLATDTNSKEVVIIDLTKIVGGKYVEAGYFNAPGNINGESVYVVGTTGYATTSNNRLYNFDLTSKAGSRPLRDPDGVALAGKGTKVIVIGNYAYVSTNSTSTQLQIVDVSNPLNLTVVGQASLVGQASRDVFVNGSATRAYVVTQSASAQREFFIVDISTKTGDRPTLGSYDTNGMDPYGVEVVPGGRAIVVGTGAEEYQAVNISNESAPTRCGGMQVDSGIHDSASVLESDNDAFSYIVTGDASSEFKMIEGGPGGQFATSGTFESSTFDAGATTAFNRFDVTFNKPTQTDITFQVAVADAVGGSCAGISFTFVGPDGTSGSFFTDDAAIPLSDDGAGFENPGRCFRYRAYFTTSDFAQSPTFYDFTVNYSP